MPELGVCCTVLSFSFCACTVCCMTIGTVYHNHRDGFSECSMLQNSVWKACFGQQVSAWQWLLLIWSPGTEDPLEKAVLLNVGRSKDCCHPWVEMIKDSLWLILKRASLNIITVINPPNLVTVCVCVCVFCLLLLFKRSIFNSKL